MTAIDTLIEEHKLIHRMLNLMKEKLTKIKIAGLVDSGFTTIWVNFFRIYADNCHHGKEENILFKNLRKKQLSQELTKTMDELIEEHIYARTVVNELSTSYRSIAKIGKSASKRTIESIEDIVRLYPLHIDKEDKNFFPLVFVYFSEEEQENMLQEFLIFNGTLFHDNYIKITEEWEEKSRHLKTDIAQAKPKFAL